MPVQDKGEGELTAQNPVIVIPGITASRLRDEYPVDPELVWGALPWQKKWDRVALHPDELKYERDEPARVAPDQVLGVAYGDLIEELRHDLSPSADKPTPVFPFAYDWRQPLESAESQLEAFIDEVIERTKLIKHYHDDSWSSRPRVDLVGHSMGGLVRGYVAHCHEERPHQGLSSRLIAASTDHRGRGPLARRQRLGELLNHYYREAA